MICQVVGLVTFSAVVTDCKLTVRSYHFKRRISHICLQKSPRHSSRFCPFRCHFPAIFRIFEAIFHLLHDAKSWHEDAGRPLRLFRNKDFACFSTAENRPKSRCFLAVRASRGRNGAAFVVQRQPRRNATAAPLQPRKALTARPSCSPRKTAAPLRFVSAYE